MKENYIGKVSNYFSNISVAAFEIESGELKVGDSVHIKGYTTDFTDRVESIQMEHREIETAKNNDVGIKVSQKVRSGDIIFVITEDLKSYSVYFFP